MLILWILLAYLLGSIPFGKIVGKWRGIDIQKKGSGNIGFANAVRVLGWKDGLVILAGDVLKGFAPVYLAGQHLSYDQTLVVAFVAVMAHIFPIWLHFKGGKGVATGLGVSLAISPLVAIMGFITYLVTVAFVRKSGPSSIAASWSLVIWALILNPLFLGFAMVLAVTGTVTHWSYIKEPYLKRRHA